MVAKVGAVFRGSLFNIFLELLLFKNTRVFGKQAEQQPHHVEFERMACVAGFLQPVVQFAHLLGGFDVDGVLLLNFVGLVSGNETEEAHVLVQVFQVEFVLFVFFQIVKADAGEVGNDDILGQIALGNAGEIIQRL
ncbi:MAG: hypothetical protein BWX55_01964 [Deltaproteobacteria bacterium ADurb.Bin022]|nr:MAG: hypothetical protein BWX55_01964 [Deltaproteobacteria bacterium ADurb.Bin022]